MQGPGARGWVSFCSRELPSPSPGGAGPNGHFLSWPGVACSPNCLQTPPPRHLPTPMPLLVPFQHLGAPPYPPQPGPVTVCLLLGFKARAFVFHSKSSFSCSPARGLENRRCWSPPMPRSMRSSEPLKACTALYLWIYLWTASRPPRPCGLLTASNLCPTPNSGPGTTSSLESAGGRGHRDLGL